MRRRLITVAFFTLALSLFATAQTETTLHTFSETTSFWPQGALVEDANGNLYGTTRGGGAYGVGSIFEMTPPPTAGGAWTLTTLYNFAPFGSGGYVPVSDLITDSTGAFYGATYAGGDAICNCGGVYKLIPPTKIGGAWTEQPLYAFTTTNSDGRLPAAFALTMTTQGIIYGVTIRGGEWDSGVIYQLTPALGGTYTESVLYSFGNLEDASTPNGPLLIDSTGALYGVASAGGVFNGGAVYKFVPAANGTLATESLLFSFKSGTKSGATPSGNLLFDSSGNLYGVTNSGAAGSAGVVYELTPAKATWTQKILFTFSKQTGTNPVAGLIWNPTTGVLYGTTTAQNGNTPGDGSVFKLLPPTVVGGAWTESTLFKFNYNVVGGYPTGAITRDPVTGTLYGTALNGGVTGCDLFCGTIWQIVSP